MKMSEKQRSKLYDCLATPVDDLRIKITREKRDATELELSRLCNVMWRKVHNVLKLEGPA